MAVEYKTPALTLKVHDNFVMAMANSFMPIGQSEIDFLVQVVNKHFSEPFAVIEVRDKNVSIDPEVHSQAKVLLPNYQAYALVTNDVKAIENFDQEEAYMKYEHHKLCNTLD